MKKTMQNNCLQCVVLTILVMATACSPGTKKSSQMKTDHAKGTYGYDVAFFEEKEIPVIELTDPASDARLLIIPGYQGRVMTSTSGGYEGSSYGWINYKLIESGETNDQFNPYGGEERFWLGPEGGPFSVYFKAGEEQVFQNWVVPREIDTEPFDIVHQSAKTAGFRKAFSLANASGTTMEVAIERTITLLGRKQAELALNMNLHESLSLVAYETENILTNKGQAAWNTETGVLSIWLLSMFNPSEKGVVFIPFIQGSEKDLGKIVTDDYFGKVPPERLLINDGILFFKTDGKFRSKIGISPSRALPFCGSYDPDKKSLTILWYSKPYEPASYVNSVWGHQDDPLAGDVVNSYNDGPVDDGSVMGPFYELESSSPAAKLKPGEKMLHSQRIFHIEGDEEYLNAITLKLFNITITEIKSAFNGQ